MKKKLMYKRTGRCQPQYYSNMSWAVLVFGFSLVLCSCVGQGSSSDFKASPDGKIFRDDYWYSPEAKGWIKIHRIPSTWSDARVTCFLEGAKLASPSDQDILPVLKDLVKERNQTFYTGIHTLGSKADFMSLEGIPLSKMPKISWADGQPDNMDISEDCLAMSPRGMEDVQCSKTFRFICYKKQVEGESFQRNECGTFGKGYRKDNTTGSCYKYHTAMTNWKRAHTICNSEGGHLAIINSEDEAQILADLVAYNPRMATYSRATVVEKGGEGKIFIGFYKWPSVGHTRGPGDMPTFFSTVDDKTLEEAGYAKWSSELNRDPTHFIHDPCGVLQLNKNELDGLNVDLCYRARPFICEIDG